MRKRVSLVRMYETFHVGGSFGELKQTLPPDNKTLPNLEMYLEDNGTITVKWDGHPGVAIGPAGYKGVVFAVEAPKPAVVPKT